MSGGARRIRLEVTGRVQGVFFRANARTTATRLGLRGWVRNRDDGRVEAVIEGPDEVVEEFIDWCHRGSPAARVDRVEIWEHSAEEELARGFDVRF